MPYLIQVYILGSDILKLLEGLGIKNNRFGYKRSKMKYLYLILLFSIMAYSFPAAGKHVATKTKHCATCKPNGNCNACTSCNYCKHCNSGGSCSVCAKSSKNNLPQKRSASSDSSTAVSCKGTTKKGLRCKRMVKGGGYCWQHSN